MATVMTLLAKMALDNSGFIQGLGEAESSAEGTAQTLGGTLGGLGSAGTLAMGTIAAGAAAAVAAIAAVGAGVTVAAVEIGKLTLEAASFEGTRTTFANLTEEIGGSEAVTQQLREATGGMVSDTDLWAASNKFLLMGLTETADETAATAEMAVQLGLAMGGNATESMENFALMMANQSIPRLDSFGISSGEARVRIEEMMAADESLTSEMAFSAVVMEMGAEKMALVGDQSETTTGAMAQYETMMANVKTGIGQGFIPVLDLLMERGEPVLTWLAEELPAAAEAAGTWIADNLAPILDKFGLWWADFFPRAKEAFTDFWLRIQPGILWVREQFAAYSAEVLPKLQDAWELVQKGFVAVSDIWREDLQPALAELWEALGLGELETDDLGETFGKLVGLFIEVSTSGIVISIVNGIKLLTGAVRLAIDVVNDLKGAWSALTTVFENIHIPMPHFELEYTQVAGVDIPKGFNVNWYGTGGDFIADRPTLIGVGDTRERVTITPLSSKNRSEGSSVVTNNYLTANYPIQRETSVAQDLRMMQLLTG